MADGTGQPVHNGLLILVDVAVGMGQAVGVQVGVLLLGQGFVNVIFHGSASFFKAFPIITDFSPHHKPTGGIFSDFL